VEYDYTKPRPRKRRYQKEIMIERCERSLGKSKRQRRRGVINSQSGAKKRVDGKERKGGCAEILLQGRKSVNEE